MVLRKDRLFADDGVVRTVLETMPFFLVTHTSLVEAGNEAAAAQHAVDAL